MFNGSATRTFAIEKQLANANDGGQMQPADSKQNSSESRVLSRRHSGGLNGSNQKTEPFFEDPLTMLANVRNLTDSVELGINQLQNIGALESSMEKQLSDAVDAGDLTDLQAANEQAVQFGDSASAEDDESSKIQITGAGLAYNYRFESLSLKLGLNGPKSSGGSEHLIDMHAYAAELQLLAYNSLLYKSYTEASTKPHGLLAVSIFIDTIPTTTPNSNGNHTTQETSDTNSKPSKGRMVPNGQLESILARLAEVKHRGSIALIRDFNLSALLPETDYFVTYEGSLTTPGCHESVNWLLLNRPLYITQPNVSIIKDDDCNLVEYSKHLHIQWVQW